MQKARRQSSWGASSPVDLRPLVGTRFQVLFHSPPGVLFTFPSRYWFTIGHERVFSLTRWSSQIPTGFHVSCGTWVSRREPTRFRLQDYHLLWSAFPDGSTSVLVCNSPALRPPGSRNTSARKRARV